jgi:acid phosphatase (class A)
MKKAHLILLSWMFCSAFTSAQNPTAKELTPTRGYYEELKAFSAKPKSPNEKIDHEKFPVDPASVEKRLSLKPYYLENVTLDDFHIPDPPANSSEQTRAELNYLLALQQQRSSLDIESSMYLASVFYNVRTKPGDSTYDQFRQNLFFIGRTIGTWFNPKDMPLTADLIAHVWQDAGFFIWSAKYKYLRVRPYKLDSQIQNLEETNWAAYPSGHAANSYINAYIYQELAPEFTDTFLKDAYDMAHSREIIGVHYPSDSEASRMLARQLVNKLFQNEKFRHDFALVRKEWADKAKERFTTPALTPAIQKKSASCNDKSASACARKCE